MTEGNECELEMLAIMNFDIFCSTYKSIILRADIGILKLRNDLNHPVIASIYKSHFILFLNI